MPTKSKNNEERAVDGFSDAMAKILHQQVPSKVPVLAKRKTPIMRELDAEVEQQQHAKKARMEKQQEKEMHLVKPHVLQADYERQLRKLATKGGDYVKCCTCCTVMLYLFIVIALFNAISTAKRDLSAAASENKKNDESKTITIWNLFKVCSGCAGDESNSGTVDEG